VDHKKNSYDKQLKNIKDLFNQRKINLDEQKVLGVEKANCMYLNLSRMDIRLWQNIVENGQTSDIIK
jgi:hypothetical protein